MTGKRFLLEKKAKEAILEAQNKIIIVRGATSPAGPLLPGQQWCGRFQEPCGRLWRKRVLFVPRFFCLSFLEIDQI